MNKLFLTAGTWDFKAQDEKGISVFEVKEDGSLEFLKSYDETVSAGSQVYDSKRHILYVGDECEGHPGKRGGGGYVRAYSMNPETGDLTFLSETGTLMTKASKLALDPSGKYLLVSCHGGRNFVTRVTYNEDGLPANEVCYDDAGVVLIGLKEDGTFDKVLDAVVHNGTTALKNQVISHPHSVYGSPDGSVYFSCDKGLDYIYAYAIDRERDRLIRLVQTKIPYASAPRYGCFHPELPVFYENNETSPHLYAFRYDKRSGYLEEISDIVTYTEENKGSQSDVLVSVDGKYLYDTVRGEHGHITVCSINQEDGSLTFIKNVENSGSLRGIALSPDGKYLYGASPEANEIICFELKDGIPEDTGKRFTLKHAANLGFVK